MYIVGIIGPYISGGDRRMIDHNIANAQYVTVMIANHFAESRLVGFFCPHSHTARFEKLAQAPESYYHELDDTIYDKVCEVFVVLPEWENSKGATRDLERASAQGKLVFNLKSYDDTDIADLLENLEKWALGLKQENASWKVHG